LHIDANEGLEPEYQSELDDAAMEQDEVTFDEVNPDFPTLQLKEGQHPTLLPALTHLDLEFSNYMGAALLFTGVNLPSLTFLSLTVVGRTPTPPCSILLS
jgi:hypothetical protein